MSNECLSCGACCAFFRVSFYWAEADDGGGQVPAQLTEPVTPFLRCMRGTNARAPRCVALQGEPGKTVSCAIYHQRPSPCREFSLSGENGITHDACNRARAHHGLPPLYGTDLLSLTIHNAATDRPSRVQSPPD
ncbi:YkgJ family cysteine cluster protein [Atlantibacter hermannii]|uniref:YkgJ family cysteine cluster protein n=1 Tax=Atlantibacter hermannii TaxID=565 RepID=UPI0028AC9775|nr:YkgJ family cysteine cluster protein [Atlantibacter hermannii]